jgi:hypothetical protein
VRGIKISIAKTQVDLVLVSARYEPGSGKLLFARGYERRGQVWTDIKLFDRKSLVEELKAGRNVMTGESLPLAGDFDVFSPVQVSPEDQLFVDEDSPSEGDHLGLPIL